MKIARLLLRLLIGGLFVGHGTQKLFGWFGGSGLEATAAGFEKMGMRPGRRNAIAGGVGETAGGAALALGFATPLASATLTAVMLTAIHRVHLKNGPWATKGGYEYNAVLIAAVLSLAEAGPGKLSIDSALGIEHSGPGWAVAAAALGAAGAIGANLSSEPAPEPEPEPAPVAEPEPVVAAERG